MTKNTSTAPVVVQQSFCDWLMTYNVTKGRWGDPTTKEYSRSDNPDWYYTSWGSDLRITIDFLQKEVRAIRLVDVTDVTELDAHILAFWDNSGSFGPDYVKYNKVKRGPTIDRLMEFTNVVWSEYLRKRSKMRTKADTV